MGGQSHPWLGSGTRLAQAGLDPGVTGGDVGDPVLTRSLPVAFLPKSFHQQPPIALPSAFPALPHVFHASPYSLPNRLSSPTPYYPLPTRCLSRLHVFMNSRRPTHVFHTSKTSPENPEEWGADREEDSRKETQRKSLKLVQQENISRNFTETASHYPPTHCLSKRRRRGKLRGKRSPEIFALWKEKMPQVFLKRSRGGDLAARLAAPQVFHW